MPALHRRLPQLTRGDALANAISILEVLQATSSVIANAPFVGSIVGAALGLAKTVEVHMRATSPPTCCNTDCIPKFKEGQRD